ncbi:MAG: hypothetical protein N2C12_04555, partial [Planctomycetales bacterium]
MSWLIEDPTVVVVVGILLIGILAVVLVKTGRAVMLLPMIIVLAIMGTCLLTDYMVVTERERIEEVIDNVIAALLNDDVPRATSHIAGKSLSLRNQVGFVLRLAK